MLELNIHWSVSLRKALTGLSLKDPGTLANARTIYNERVRIRKESFKVKEHMEALMDDFLSREITVSVRV